MWEFGHRYVGVDVEDYESGCLCVCVYLFWKSFLPTYLFFSISLSLSLSLSPPQASRIQGELNEVQSRLRKAAFDFHEVAMCSFSLTPSFSLSLPLLSLSLYICELPSHFYMYFQFSTLLFSSDNPASAPCSLI